MTDDRAEFTANRDAGLVKRHEQRLARAREGIEFPADGVERTAYLEGEPVIDMVIPPEALKAAALGIHCRMSIGRGHFIGGDRPTPTNEDLATAALEAALPHLRPMLELAGNLGRELGRREAAEELAVRADQLAENYQATAVAHRDLSDRTTTKGVAHGRTASAFRNKADGAWAVAYMVREIATEEPK